MSFGLIFTVYLYVSCFLLKLFQDSAPIGWSQNFFKKKIFEFGLKLADKIIVNSNEFKKDLKKEFNINATCIYNPLNKNEILNKSKKKISKNF